MKKIISLIFMLTFVFDAYCSQGPLVIQQQEEGRTPLSLAIQFGDCRQLEGILSSTTGDAMSLLLPQEQKYTSQEYYKEAECTNASLVIYVLRVNNQDSILQNIYLPIVLQSPKLSTATGKCIKKIFLEKTIDINKVSVHGKPSLICLMEKGQTFLAKELLEVEGVNLRCCDETGNTLFHLAVKNMFKHPLCNCFIGEGFHFIRILATKDANIWMKNGEEETFFDIALLNIRGQTNNKSCNQYAQDPDSKLIKRFINLLCGIIDRSNIDNQEKANLIKEFKQTESDFELAIEKSDLKKQAHRNSLTMYYIKKKFFVFLGGAALIGLFYYLYNCSKQ